jgi:uncharacterized protein (UPF0332 family)
LAKAERFLQAADRAFAAEDWETTASRAYYGAYHAAIAALESRTGMRRRRWDHLELQRQFRVAFARRGYLFSVRHAEALERLYEARLAADYEREILPGRRVQQLLENARRFYEDVIEEIPNV